MRKITAAVSLFLSGYLESGRYKEALDNWAAETFRNYNILIMAATIIKTNMVGVLALNQNLGW